jgi:Na+/melibiose symporter-like transporter
MLTLNMNTVTFRLGGYESGACEQSKDVALALRMLVVPGPVVFVLIALLFLWAYPIDEDRRVYNKARLEKMRQVQFQDIGLDLNGNNVTALLYNLFEDIIHSFDARK